LPHHELRAIGLPEVWKTPEGLLISDGNQRTAAMAKRGREKIHVDLKQFNPELQMFFAEQYEEILARAKKLRENGIYNPYDLLRA
jgi:hypothetical protein